MRTLERSEFLRRKIRSNINQVIIDNSISSEKVKWVDNNSVNIGVLYKINESLFLLHHFLFRPIEHYLDSYGYGYFKYDEINHEPFYVVDNKFILEWSE